MSRKSTSVQSIIVDRLIKRIESENRLPWQKPFHAASINWYSKTEYRGVNKFLLDGGEYITPNQLKRYNERKGTDFWFKKGTQYELVVFYTRNEKEISDAEAKRILDNNPHYTGLHPIENGKWIHVKWVLRYYRVYNIKYIFDSNGNTLEPRLGNSLVEEYTPAEDIINTYVNASGVRITNGMDGAYYTHVYDRVTIPKMNYFATPEAYYRVLFHELVHSTGIKSRLDRDCFHKYHDRLSERSKEELVAEIGSILLASEAGFRDDSQWVENSEEYIAGWVGWMKNHEREVLNGFLDAEKAKNYILSGCQIKTATTEASTDNNPAKNVEAGEV